MGPHQQETEIYLCSISTAGHFASPVFLGLVWPEAFGGNCHVCYMLSALFTFGNLAVLSLALV